MKAEFQQQYLKPITLKQQGGQQNKQSRSRGICRNVDKAELKRIKTEESDVYPSSDQILLQREEYGDKNISKGKQKFMKDEVISGDQDKQHNHNNNNINENTQVQSQEDNVQAQKKIVQNQQQQQQKQYQEFWYEQSKKGKYIDQLPVINNQNQGLPQVGNFRSPQNSSNLGQYMVTNNQKLRNFSAASKEPIKTPHIKQPPTSTTSKSNKKNNFQIRDDQNSTTVNNQNQISGECNNSELVDIRSYSPSGGNIGKTILRSYTLERGNQLNEELKVDKNMLPIDEYRRNSSTIQRVLNRSQTRTPNKNHQPISLQHQNLNSELNNIQPPQIKQNQNHLQQMRNLQNSQITQQQYNNDMYNFYYNQDSKNPLNSKKNSQKNNILINTSHSGQELDQSFQQQAYDKYLLSKPSRVKQSYASANKLNRNTPLKENNLDLNNDVLNKSDNCLLSPIKFSPKEQGEQQLSYMPNIVNNYDTNRLAPVPSTTKQIAVPANFKKNGKIKLRSKENLDHDFNNTSMNEGRNIKTEGSVIDGMPMISQVHKQPYKYSLNQSLMPSSSSKKSNKLNVKETFFVKYNKLQSQRNIDQQIETLKNLSEINQYEVELDKSKLQESNKSQEINTQDTEKDKTKLGSSHFNFYEIDPTIQREESIKFPSNENLKDQAQEQQQQRIYQENIDYKTNQEFNKQISQTENTQADIQQASDKKIMSQVENISIQENSSLQTPQKYQSILELNSDKTLNSSLTETPNRSRQITTYQSANIQSNQDLIQESNNQNQNLNQNNALDTKKPLLKVKLNLETLLFIEEKIFLIFEQVQFHDNISYVHTCKDYLELITTCEQERLERLFGDKQMRKLVKKCLILERLTINLIIYLTLDGAKKDHFNYNVVNLMETISQNYIIILNLLCNQIKTQGIPQNEWIAKMEEVIQARRPSIPPQNSVLFLQNNFGKGVSLIGPVIEIYPDLKKLVNDIFKDLEKSSTQVLITNLLEFFAKKINNYELNRQLATQEEFEGPFLPPAKNDNVYTLVLDLDETLIHFVDTPVGGHFLMRPFLEMFLKEMSKIYEIVIFTVGMENYANWVIDSFDKNKYISHRLYRQHAFSKQYNYIKVRMIQFQLLPQQTQFLFFNLIQKDLSKLGRDLSRSLIVDNVADNFRLQPANGIHIKSWFSDSSDTALKELIPVLKELIKQKPADIRPTLKQLKNKYTPQRVKYFFTLPPV
ncbi:NLI interacting factor-like phosphatase (macronuclear) [Tetrahymena thermophila SB210]|uniref:NLI interacting factor-like phosphatase n=1 Tax=Tetrahymena thermophila (strain SB210) TaxID=312017 RepID=Q23JH8_TETTS|nr:NLI interacting factor-like phosphatase [Tetrahymena thermophila SB210]EAR96666.2 NLI interacting factor-like phosphatase [Tetrahymena thermophila SB210]|eukprot:XP_001016911.2 NLI interacting factor-like phosphatase [Tetrahymena thermophila SB210]